jgi:hypothetical protein
MRLLEARHLSSLVEKIVVNKTFQETWIMTSRRNRKRTAFGFESLEIRNAPSHFGIGAHAAFGIGAHAAAAIHPVRAAAHVRHLTDSEANHKKEATEARSSVDSSQDSSRDQSNSGSTSTDPSSNDPNSVDPKSDR